MKNKYCEQEVKYDIQSKNLNDDKLSVDKFEGYSHQERLWLEFLEAFHNPVMIDKTSFSNLS